MFPSPGLIARNISHSIRTSHGYAYSKKRHCSCACDRGGRFESPCHHFPKSFEMHASQIGSSIILLTCPSGDTVNFILVSDRAYSNVVQPVFDFGLHRLFLIFAVISMRKLTLTIPEISSLQINRNEYFGRKF